MRFLAALQPAPPIPALKRQGFTAQKDKISKQCVQCKFGGVNRTKSKITDWSAWWVLPLRFLRWL